MWTYSTEYSMGVILQVLKLLMSCRTHPFTELITVNQICLASLKGRQ